MMPYEHLLDRATKALEECADVLKRSERLLERALALRDGRAPDPVQLCGADFYSRDSKRCVCDLEINHRGNHATGGVFWRVRSGNAVCAEQQPSPRWPDRVRRCELPALHDTSDISPHSFELDGNW